MGVLAGTTYIPRALGHVVVGHVVVNERITTTKIDEVPMLYVRTLPVVQTLHTGIYVFTELDIHFIRSEVIMLRTVKAREGHSTANPEM